MEYDVVESDQGSEVVFPCRPEDVELRMVYFYGGDHNLDFGAATVRRGSTRKSKTEKNVVEFPLLLSDFDTVRITRWKRSLSIGDR